MSYIIIKKFRMNDAIVNGFIRFYIETLNDKNRFEEFITVWKEYTVAVHNSAVYTKETLLNYIRTLYSYTIKFNKTDDIIVSFTLNGDRRANILISYQMHDNLGNIINVSQYILLAYSNSNEYWIHTSLINFT